MNITHPAIQAALIDLGGGAAAGLVGLIILFIILGFVWLVWSKVCMPLLSQVVGEPFLGIINWLVIAVLCVIAIIRTVEVLFGISVFSGG